MNYLLNSVLRFDYKDFVTAVKIDLGPVLGDIGVWVLQCLHESAKEKKDTELKKKT